MGGSNTHPFLSNIPNAAAYGKFPLWAAAASAGEPGGLGLAFSMIMVPMPRSRAVQTFRIPQLDDGALSSSSG